MGEMFGGVLDGRGAALVTAILVVSVALLAMVVVFWLVKGRQAGGGFARSTRSQPRLAVLDSAAVDTRRRLVLVRRDDVEHLIMIGGPSDIVIESRIAASAIPAVDPVETRQPPREAANLQRETAAADADGRAEPAPQPLAKPAPPPTKAARSAAPTAAGVPITVSTDALPATRPADADADPADILDQARRRVLSTAPAQFPPERFAKQRGPEMRAASAKPATASGPAAETIATIQPKGADSDAPAVATGVTAGNPFDDDDFGSILDAEMARDLAALEVMPPRSAAPVPTVDTPMAKSGPQRQDENTLEEEMARLLGGMTADRR